MFYVVEKAEHNTVDIYVYKIEDMSVSDVKKPEEQAEPWVIAWANYLTSSITVLHEDDRFAAQSLIQELLISVSQGHSCLRTTQASVKRLASLVSFAEKKQTTPFIFFNECLYLYRYYALEQRLAQQVYRLCQQKVAKVTVRSGLKLLEDPQQIKALEMVAQEPFSIITGGPGTGKTYTLARIIAVLNDGLSNLRIAMAAPTGKAAQRMQEALQSAFLGNNFKESGLDIEKLKVLQPVTLHRLLKIGHQGQAGFNAKQPLPYDVVVVDEASMLDLNLATQLFEAVGIQTRLILLGDANQLTSVDVGAVLADLQQSPELSRRHCVELKYSRRFSADAKIGAMATFIQLQKTQQNAIGDVVRLFEKDIVSESIITSVELANIKKDMIQLQYIDPSHVKSSQQTQANLQSLWLGFAEYAEALQHYCQAEDEMIEKAREVVLTKFDDYRILTAMHHGTFGVQQINDYMQIQLMDALAPWSQAVGDWYIGRPVMIRENNYQLGLSNGDIGICFQHRTDVKQFEVYFPSLKKWVLATRLPKHIQTAFAMTIHKSQGSEFTHTAVVLEQSAQRLLSQELLYTAITRAKKVVTLLVDRDAFECALTEKTIRNSGLVEMMAKNETFVSNNVQ